MSHNKKNSEKSSLRRLITRGDLDALLAHIRAGQPLRVKWGHLKRPKSAVEFAVETGFYSQVNLLLEECTWEPPELEWCLQYVLYKGRADLVRLLIQHGAPAVSISTEVVFKSMDIDIMGQFLELGMDPCADNAFARILHSAKAKPLLRFYKEFHEAYPCLKDQICIALVLAIHQENARWIMLLVWAGADLHREVNVPIYGDFDDLEDDFYRTTAYQALMNLNNLEILEMLKIQITPDIKLRKLRRAAYEPEREAFMVLMADSTVDDLNSGERGGCPALEEIVDENCHDLSKYLPSQTGRREQEETLMRMDILLEAGAKWLPSPERIKSTRRDLNTHPGEFIAQLLRKLIFTSEAATVEDIWELCHPTGIRKKIHAADPKLWHAIYDMASEAGLPGASRRRRTRS